MTVTKASIFVIILVALFFGYRIWQSQEAEVVAVPAVQSIPKTEVPVVATDSTVAATPEISDVPASSQDEPGCLSVQQVVELPEFRQEVARMESVSVAGAALNAYENLGEDTLQNFANQGDSAAMAVLGAINVMRAYEKDDSQAISWLNGNQTIADFIVGTDALSANASLALNEAAYWFYEAASHGRVMALQQHGRVKGRLFGGPVGLGWVSQVEYDALSPDEKNSLNPNNLYGQVSYDVVPKLREGAFGSLLSGLLPTSSKQKEIRDQLRTEFSQNLEDRGLPEIQIAAAETDGMDDLFSRVCSSVEQEEIRRLGLE